MTSAQDQFNALSNQSSEKLKKIIETVQSYQTRMEPLNKNMEQLQILQRNLESCRSKLSQVQEYHRAGRELENTIRQGPTALLNDYLKAMERIKEALAFFQENNPQDVEFSRLTSLYSVGLGSLEREFDGLLRQAFRPINDATLIRLMDHKGKCVCVCMFPFMIVHLYFTLYLNKHIVLQTNHCLVHCIAVLGVVVS
ncbi:unnamed protein product [Trichobilharzia regenti]|nr:unnamed protein product [Trichobilharzia regenti]